MMQPSCGSCQAPALFVLTPSGAGPEETFRALACAAHLRDLLLHYACQIGTFRVEALADAIEKRGRP